ncbi:FxSxx-COOH cyclophane-containing RiPP peptide [Frankia tisae]|uniref:FxSxx-COOH cyclophane-containing RiPP peptide n=1 Tax=Frankia tisae TaxID=2950104 RepID=UPI0021BF6E4E|nr:FxSxx-COOH cyclophane-containing RiPP peptide [Frankia tisae]
MDRWLTGIETRLPDLTGWPLDAIEAVDSPVLRRALRRMGREAGQQSPSLVGFNSSIFTSSSSAT